ncbi:MAG: aspartate aminotransferase [Bacteroidetes bacterium CG02_land_8_20_14_3_00_31_25]|nr:MAG: aspartate aminotransferase [Bacteroidetes bacterium CG02_land_8_20_14_3_00_31_25]PIY02984.1 MAG: aspartate aminotransferase [Bacteroidetes bacterium CG_4_10_14_3_um_filter_31_20]
MNNDINYSKLISARINRITESQTIAMTVKSRELKAKGIDIINLSLGELDFNTPEHIKEAGKKAIDDNFSHYPPVAGYDELREAIVQKFKYDNNLIFTPNQIVVSNGAKHSIMNVILSIINPGDEVILPVPYWLSYIEMVKLAGGKPVLINSTIENDFKVTPQQIEKAITNKTKLFLFSSPSNPTGTVYNKNELKQFAEVFAKHKQIMVMSDEIYEQILYEGKHESIGQFNEIKNQLIVVNGVSKGYAMTGWRIGYIAAPEWLAKACTKLQSQFTSGASAVSQKAAFKAISGVQTETYKMRDILKKRRDLMVELFKEIPDFKTNIPKGAFYFFADVKNYFGKTFENNIIKNDVDLCLFLLNNAHVAVVGGSSFGSPDYLRFSYATPESNLIEAVRRIKDSLEILEL